MDSDLDSGFSFSVERPAGKRRTSAASLVSALAADTDSSYFSNDTSGSARRLVDKDIGLVGRTQPVRLLREAFDRVSKGASECIFVKGGGGTGKSSLIDTALREYVAGHEGFLCYGKFDQSQTSEPFPALVEAFTDLIDLIVSTGSRGDVDESDDDRSVWRASLRQKIEANLTPDELRVMSRVIYNIKYLVGDFLSSQANDEEQQKTIDASLVLVRFKLICATFLRITATREHPVVLVVDDLQWGDLATREVLKAFMNDAKSTHVLLVLAYRPGEFDESGLQKNASSDAPMYTQSIALDDLTVSQTNILLAEILARDEEECTELGQVVFSKTQGNPYHVLRFVESLDRTGLIHRDEADQMWTWNLPAIQSRTNVSENVVALLQDRIAKLPQKLSFILQVASYFGFRFEFDSLEGFLFAISDHPRGLSGTSARNAQTKGSRVDLAKKLRKWLDAAIRKGMIERSGETSYKFSHDRVQEAFRSLVKEGDARKSLHVKIGNHLYKTARALRDTGSNLIVQAVDHLNAGSDCLDAEKKVELAKLNLEASKVASRNSALLAAREYSRKGISLLDANRLWADHYRLALDLHSSLADFGGPTGELKDCKEILVAIETHAQSISDKVRAYSAVIGQITVSGQLEDAANLSAEILSSLGFKFPQKPSKLHILLELIRTRRSISGRSSRELVLLPECTSDRIVATHGVLSQMAIIGFWAADKGKLAIASLWLVRLTCKYGVSKYSPIGFALYAMLTLLLGKSEEAMDFGNLVLELQERLNMDEIAAKALAHVHSFVLPWKLPHRDSIDGFKRAYHLAIATGDSQSAFLSGMGLAALSHHTGTPLWETEQRCSTLANSIINYGQGRSLRAIVPLYQTVLNMQNHCENVAELEGKATELLNGLPLADHDNDTTAKLLLMGRINVACFAEDYDRLETLLPRFDKNHPPQLHYTFYQSTFQVAMAYCELWRRKGTRRYRQKAREKVKVLEKLVENGNLNCIPYLTIAQAEELSLSSTGASMNSIVTQFEQGAMEAAALSLVHVEATAYERIASYLLVTDESSTAAAGFIRNAAKLYDGWGADAMLDVLREKYGSELVDVDQEEDCE